MSWGYDILFDAKQDALWELVDGGEGEKDRLGISFRELNTRGG
jgi:hypothetical protein